MERASDKHGGAGATQQVMDQLGELPHGQRFETVEAVWEALGGHAERRF